MNFLRLVFTTTGPSLMVREAFSGEKFEEDFHWKDKLEFTVSDSTDFTMLWTSLLPDLEPTYAEALVDLVAARYPVSLEFEKLRSYCPKLTYSLDADEWVFYGGTFDPWHPGHQACLDLLPPDKVCFVLPDRNPLKAITSLNPVATILELSTRGRFRPLQFLVPSFLLSAEKNPTVEWIERLRRIYPNRKLSLLLGFDSFEDLPLWRRHEDLLRALSCIYVVSRLEDGQRALGAQKRAHGINPKLSVVFLGRHPHEALSSSSLRKKEGTP